MTQSQINLLYVYWQWTRTAERHADYMTRRRAYRHAQRMRSMYSHLATY